MPNSTQNWSTQLLLRVPQDYGLMAAFLFILAIGVANWFGAGSYVTDRL
jgi:hypothetical protein